MVIAVVVSGAVVIAVAVDAIVVAGAVVAGVSVVRVLHSCFLFGCLSGLLW